VGDHTLAYRSEDAAIYVNHDALPRAFVVHQAQTVTDDNEALRLLSDPAFDPRETVLVDAEIPSPLGAPGAVADSVEIQIDEHHRLELSVSASASGYLVLADTWYPGWKAEVNGLLVPVLRANLMFRAIHLEQGTHAVRFVYQPGSFRMGLVISAASLAMLGIAAALHRCKRSAQQSGCCT
jgi:hypothetical protein